MNIMARERKKIMKFFTNVYNNGQTWLDTMKLREAKKQQEAVVLQSEKAFQATETNHGVKAQVVFTHEDQGHNAKESQRIQKLYADLESFRFVPRFVTH